MPSSTTTRAWAYYTIPLVLVQERVVFFMRENVVQRLQVMLSNDFSIEQIKLISRQLSIVLNDYEVTMRETSLIEYGSNVPEIVKMYLVSKKIEGMAETTYNNYFIALKDFFQQINKYPDKITTNDIRVYLYRYQERKNASNSTMDQKRTIINGFFEWTANEGYTSSNPARPIKPIKYERKERQAMTQLELEKVRLACKDTRDRAIVEMLYSTGCRVSELAGLNIDDINFETKEVKLFGKGSKHRTSYLNAKAEIALREYLKERQGDADAVFVSSRAPYGRIRKCTIEKIVRDIMQRTGGEIKKNVTPHVFRHTTATVAVNNGMAITEVSKLLGHERVDTTMIYTKTSMGNVKESYKRCVI